MIKTELHCHLDGAIPNDLFVHFAKEQGLLDCGEEEWIAKHIMDTSASLEDALSRFGLYTSLLQTKEHLSLTTEGLIEQKYNEGVRLLEIRFAPQLHTAMTMEEAVEAVLDGQNNGLKKHPDMVCGIILAMMNNDETELNAKTIDLANQYKDKGVVGIDLAGNEGYRPMEDFLPMIQKAHDLGLHITLHAGESKGEEFVKFAVDHYAERIGHGIHASGNDDLLEEIMEKDLILEVSVTSNVLSYCVPSLAEHPVRELFDKGVKISINTDDPTLFGIDLDHEYNILKERFHFTDRELILMNLEAAQASFCKDKEKVIEKIKEELIASV